MPHHLPCDLTKTSINPGTLIILTKSFVSTELAVSFPPLPLYLLYFPLHSKPVCVVHSAVLQVCAVGQHGRLGTIGVAVLLGFAITAAREPLTLDVSLDPEVGEEDEEKHAIDPDKVDKDGHLVFTVFHEVILRDMDRHYDKLSLWKQTRKRVINWQTPDEIYRYKTYSIKVH